MAENVQITPGSGVTIGADSVADGVLGSAQIQYIKIMDGTIGGTNKAAVTANGLAVDGSGATQPISALTLPLPTGAATELTLGDIKSDLDQFTFVASKLLIDGSTVTQPISAVALPLPAGAATESTLSAVKDDVDNLDVALSTRATEATLANVKSDLDQFTFVASALLVDGSGAIQPVSGTVTANAGTGNFTVVQSVGANLHAEIDNFPSSQTVNGTVAATQSGTWTVALSSGSIEIGTVDQGSPNTLANAWPFEITDGTNILGTAVHPIRIDPTGTTTQPISGSVSVSNFPATQPISGTVTANAGTGNFTVVQATASSLNATVTGTVIATQATGTNLHTVVDSGSITVANATLAVTQSTSPWVVSLASTTITGTVAVTQSGTWNLNNISGTISLPTGASTAAKQPALGVAGTASTDVITVQGIASMTALKVDGSAVTQPISGTVSVSNFPATQAVTQSGTWTVGLTTESIEIGKVDQGTPNTLANAWPVELSDGTNLLGVSAHPVRIDPTGTTTQPISGTVTANQGTSPWVVSLASTTITGTVAVTQSTSPWVVSGTVTANAGTGTFAVSAASLPLPTGASTSAKQPALGTAGTASSDVITVQGIASMTALKVDGSAVTQPISGSVSISNFPATQPVSGTITANQGTSPWVVSLASTTITGTVAVTQSTSPWVISGTVTSNIGTTNGLALDATVAGLQVSQGSATSGQKGGLILGAVTTGAPTYITAQSSPLSLDTAGNLRVTIAASASEQAVNLNQVGGSAISLGQTTMASSLPVVIASNQAAFPVTLASTTITGTVASTQSGAWTTGRTWTLASGTDSVSAVQSGTWNIGNITGTVSLPTGASTDATLAKLTLAQAATTSGSTGPMIQGAVTTAAPSYTTGTVNPLSLDLAGNLRVTLSASTAEQNVNLNQVGGSAIALGQTTMSASLPVTLASNQSALPVTLTSTTITGTVAVTQSTSPWVVSGTVTTTPPANASTNITEWNSIALGSPSAYGTSPGAVNVIGVNAFITNTPTVTANAGTGIFTVGQATGTNLHTVVDSGSITVANATIAVTQSTSPWVVSLASTTITGTVAVTQSGTWSTRTQDGSGNAITSTSSALDINLKSSSITLNTKDSADGPVTPGTAATMSVLMGGQYNTTPPAPTNGQQVALQVSSAGELLTSTNDDLFATINITTQDLVTTNTTGANGQIIYTGTPTVGSVAVFTLLSDQAMTIEVSGTWTGTLQVEVSMDNGTTWFQRTLHQTGTNFTSASFTANFTGAANIAGYTNLRVRAIAAMTGTAIIRTNSTANINIIYVDSGVKILDNAGNVAAMTTKGIQATPLLGVQQPKDSGRTYITFTADAVAGVTSETLVTFTLNKQGTTTATQTNYTPTNGKTLRVQSITLSVQSGAGAGGWVRIKLRHNTAGATTTSSALVTIAETGTSNATALGAGLSVPIPDGLEFFGDGTQTIGFTHLSSAITNVESITICGYEY